MSQNACSPKTPALPSLKADSTVAFYTIPPVNQPFLSDITFSNHKARRQTMMNETLMWSARHSRDNIRQELHSNYKPQRKEMNEALMCTLSTGRGMRWWARKIHHITPPTILFRGRTRRKGSREFEAEAVRRKVDLSA